MNSYRFIYLIIVVLILALIAVCWALWPRYYLSIVDRSNGKQVLMKKAVPGDNLWIAYVNSVEHLPVADQFKVDDQYGIEFSETIYMAPFAGYLKEEYAESISRGVTRIPNMNKKIDTYSFCAGYTYKHFLFLNGNLIPLYDVARGGDTIEIRIEKKVNVKLFGN